MFESSNLSREIGRMLCYRCRRKNIPTDKNTLGSISSKNNKSGGGEHFLLLDCRVTARRKGVFLSETPVWNEIKLYTVILWYCDTYYLTWHDTTRRDMTLHDMARHGTIWHDMVWGHMIWYAMIWCGMSWYVSVMKWYIIWCVTCDTWCVISGIWCMTYHAQCMM